MPEDLAAISLSLNEGTEAIEHGQSINLCVWTATFQIP